MLIDLKKEKTVHVLNHLEESQSEVSSILSGSKNDLDFIRKVEQAFQNLELKRITNRRVNPTSLTKNWYPRPTPPDIQFEERNIQNQFSVSSDKLYEWNIDGLSEQEILNKLQHISMVANNYITKHNLSQSQIVDLLVTGFT